MSCLDTSGIPEGVGNEITVEENLRKYKWSMPLLRLLMKLYYFHYPTNETSLCEERRNHKLKVRCIFCELLDNSLNIPAKDKHSSHQGPVF